MTPREGACGVVRAQIDRAASSTITILSARHFLSMSDEDVYVAESIVDHKHMGSTLHFLVRWVGYSPEEDTWEPRENILDKRLLREYAASSGVDIGGLDDDSPEEWVSLEHRRPAAHLVEHRAKHDQAHPGAGSRGPPRGTSRKRSSLPARARFKPWG